MEHFQASKPLAANVTQSSKMQYTVEKSSSVITAETAAVRQTDLFPWTRNYVCQPLWDSHYEHANIYFKSDSSTGPYEGPKLRASSQIFQVGKPREAVRQPGEEIARQAPEMEGRARKQRNNSQVTAL